jgi:hypothetical protein
MVESFDLGLSNYRFCRLLALVPSLAFRLIVIVASAAAAVAGIYLFRDITVVAAAASSAFFTLVSSFSSALSCADVVGS